MKIKIWYWRKSDDSLWWTENADRRGRVGWGPYKTMGALKGAAGKHWKHRGKEGFEFIECLADGESLKTVSPQTRFKWARKLVGLEQT